MPDRKHDKADMIRELLWLGKPQAEIADEVGLSEGTISKYHQHLKTTEGRVYIKLRKRNKGLKRAGLPPTQAEEILKEIQEMWETESFPHYFTFKDFAAVLSLTVCLYEEVQDKHELTEVLRKTAEVVDELGLDIYQIVEYPELLQNEIKLSIDTPGRRTMTEARKQKGFKLFTM